MRIYLHTHAQHDADAVETTPQVTLAAALGIAPDDDTVVLLEDGEEPLDLTRDLSALGLVDRAHLFAGRRYRVVAEVKFNDRTIERRFPASARIARVFRWAVGEDGFDLGREDAAEHALALCETGQILPRDVHLGSLDDATPGRVALALVPKHRFEG